MAVLNVHSYFPKFLASEWPALTQAICPHRTAAKTPAFSTSCVFALDRPYLVPQSIRADFCLGPSRIALSDVITCNSEAAKSSVEIGIQISETSGFHLVVHSLVHACSCAFNYHFGTPFSALRQVADNNAWKQGKHFRCGSKRLRVNVRCENSPLISSATLFVGVAVVVGHSCSCSFSSLMMSPHEFDHATPGSRRLGSSSVPQRNSLPLLQWRPCFSARQVDSPLWDVGKDRYEKLF